MTFKTTMNRAMDLLPAFFLLSGLVVVYLSYRISGRNMRIGGEKVICPGPFFLMHLPRVPVLISVGLLGTALAMNYFMTLGIEPYILNGLVVVVTLLACQGMSIVNFYLLRFVPSPIVRGFIMFLSWWCPSVKWALRHWDSSIKSSTCEALRGRKP